MDEENKEQAVSSEQTETTSTEPIATDEATSTEPTTESETPSQE